MTTQTRSIDDIPHASGMVGIYAIPEGHLIHQVQAAMQSPCMRCTAREYLAKCSLSEPERATVVFSFESGPAWDWQTVKCSERGVVSGTEGASV